MKKERLNRYDLELLQIDNGRVLLLCEVSIFDVSNPLARKCKGLIDTGAERTVVSRTIIDRLKPNINQKFIKKEVFSLMNDGLAEADVIPLGIGIPVQSENFEYCSMVVMPMSRSEYQVIIGMDILRTLTLHVDIENNEAYIMY